MYEVRKHVTDKKLKDYGFRFKSDGDYTYRTVIYQDGKRPVIFLTFYINLEERNLTAEYLIPQAHIILIMMIVVKVILCIRYLRIVLKRKQEN